MMGIVLKNWRNKSNELYFDNLAGKRIAIKNPKYQKYNGRIVGNCDCGKAYLIELDGTERGKPLNYYPEFSYQDEIDVGNLVVVYGWVNNESKNYRLYEFDDMEAWKEIDVIDGVETSKDEIKQLIKKLEL